MVSRNQDLVEALAEFDRTGQLKKTKYKERVNLTLDMDLMRSFRQYCENNKLKMSSVVEKLIGEMLRSKKQLL